MPGVKLIAGVYDPPWMAEPGPAFVRMICEQLRTLPADWVVVDLGPGLDVRTIAASEHEAVVAAVRSLG